MAVSASEYPFTTCISSTRSTDSASGISRARRSAPVLRAISFQPVGRKLRRIDQFSGPKSSTGVAMPQHRSISQRKSILKLTLIGVCPGVCPTIRQAQHHANPGRPTGASAADEGVHPPVCAVAGKSAENLSISCKRGWDVERAVFVLLTSICFLNGTIPSFRLVMHGDLWDTSWHHRSAFGVALEVCVKQGGRRITGWSAPPWRWSMTTRGQT